MEVKNKNLEKNLKRYFKSIGNSLLCKRSVKAKMLNDLKNEIDDYIERQPESTFDSIVNHFGTPHSIAEEFAAGMGVDYIKKTKFNKIIKIITIVVSIVLAIVIVISAAIVISNSNRERSYYYEETISDYEIV